MSTEVKRTWIWSQLNTSNTATGSKCGVARKYMLRWSLNVVQGAIPRFCMFFLFLQMKERCMSRWPKFDTTDSQDGNHVAGDYGWRGSATLTYSITWRPYPQPSRLKGEEIRKSRKSSFDSTENWWNHSFGRCLARTFDSSAASAETR